MRLGIIVLALLLSLAGFSALAGTPQQTVYDRLLGSAADGDLSVLAEVLRDTFAQEDLLRFFDGNADATVFAPTNAAIRGYIDSLSEDERAALLDPKTGRLEKLLRHHVTQGTWDFRSPGLPGAILMLDDNLAHVYREGKDLKVDQALILEQAHLLNGVIAKISSVISPAPTLLGCSIFVSEHDNYLDFSPPGSNLFAGLTMDVTAHSITDCQPWDGASIQGSSLLVKAGRHDSSKPANFFKQGLSSSNMYPTLSQGSTSPAELNFALEGNFTVHFSDVSYHCPGVRFGQGSVDNNNNWWVGQPGSVSCSDEGFVVSLLLSCTNDAGNGRSILVSRFTNDHTFAIAESNPGPSC